MPRCWVLDAQAVKHKTWQHQQHGRCSVPTCTPPPARAHREARSAEQAEELDGLLRKLKLAKD